MSSEEKDLIKSILSYCETYWANIAGEDNLDEAKRKLWICILQEFGPEWEQGHRPNELMPDGTIRGDLLDLLYDNGISLELNDCLKRCTIDI